MSILVLTSDTLIGTPATGNLEYNGQFYGTDSNASRAQLQRITQGTAVASTSGTSIDFTGLPAWCKRITVMLNGVSTSGTSRPMAQIGSGSFLTSGYAGQFTGFVNAGAITSNALSAGFTCGIYSGNTELNAGAFTITLLGSNIWTCTAQVSNSTYNASCICSGSVTLSGTLDRVRITTVNGTDTFDAGSINILYEG